MQFVYGFITGLFIALIGWYIFAKSKEAVRENKDEKGSGLIEEQGEIKAENLARLEELVASRERITNQEVEELLNISDSTATRYLDELEKSGKLKQIDNGKETYYEKN